MKFFSVAVLAVLFCAVTVYAVPSFIINDDDDSNSFDADKEIKNFRKSMKCVDDVFAELVGEHKELEKYYLEFKTHVKETILQLDECEKIENPESKTECAMNAVIIMVNVHFQGLLDRLTAENEELADKLMSSIPPECR